jgi:hypothetical protein
LPDVKILSSLSSKVSTVTIVTRSAQIKFD